MPRGALSLMAVIGVCLTFGGTDHVRAGGVAAAATGLPAPGSEPGFGGFGPIRGGRGCPHVQFLGVTTRRFPPGVGALAASRACDEEHPLSRLCEWADIFRAIPPIGLDTEVLVAPNYETRPVPTCLNPNGGLTCSRSTVMRPAACCGFLVPPPLPSPASITLTPADPQTVSACTDTFEFTATAYDAQGAPMAGTPLVFEFPPVVGGTQNLIGFFNPSSGLSDDNGQVATTLTFFESSCQFNCAGGKDCYTAVQAHDLGRIIFSNVVNLVDAIP